MKDVGINFLFEESVSVSHPQKATSPNVKKGKKVQENNRRSSSTNEPAVSASDLFGDDDSDCEGLDGN